MEDGLQMGPVDRHQSMLYDGMLILVIEKIQNT